MKQNLILLLFLVLASAWANPAIAAPLSGTNLLTQKAVEVRPGKKGTVVVFLSATCPCSNSHVGILKKLAEDFGNFSFVAVHSNSEETQSQAYFQKAALPFPVLRDDEGKLADRFKALKTPHAFLLDPEEKILYRGGVTNSSNGPEADEQYLRDALADVDAGREVKVKERRTLGCVISRASHVR